MHRIDGDGHVDNLFVSEDPNISQPPTEITADIMNALQEELATFVEWSGLTLDKLDNTQLKQALLAKFLEVDVGATKAGIQAQTYTDFTTTGTSGAFLLSPNPMITGYVSGQRFRVRFHVAGNGSDTINIDGLGPKSIKQYDCTGAKVAPVITAGQRADIEYDGTDMLMVDPLPQIIPSALPVGSILFVPMSYAPSLFLKANGAALSTSAYPELFAVIGYTFGGSGGTFYLPDLRGEFIRGLDDGRGVDGGRSLGSYQSSQNLSHAHTVYLSEAVFSGGPTGNNVTNNRSIWTDLNLTSSYSGGNEARPRNIALLALIKYK
uniref:Phage Tail Collar Domain n=1 Tax=Candidatus Kentrum sp. TUN TaxID=2126343 RepID=A0A451A6J1_9GAMM|nr:MAG: Phage Tail Collar Domain [Candidatus Kentron sp. TUN]VFK61639.1 MAG: Phage Tail Collar Domain [Candidatus Kentron sp. TUN]VFK67353.1 MAG: Phage Tail Collar Domain [Candidatus Kentron sp. TUN]